MVTISFSYLLVILLNSLYDLLKTKINCNNLLLNTEGVHKVSFPIVTQLLNHLFREAIAYTW